VKVLAREGLTAKQIQHALLESYNVKVSLGRIADLFLAGKESR
jgi:hypothetical protein